MKKLAEKQKDNKKIIFMNYLEFHNVKQKMNLEKIIV